MAPRYFKKTVDGTDLSIFYGEQGLALQQSMLESDIRKIEGEINALALQNDDARIIPVRGEQFTIAEADNYLKVLKFRQEALQAISSQGASDSDSWQYTASCKLAVTAAHTSAGPGAKAYAKATCGGSVTAFARGDPGETKRRSDSSNTSSIFVSATKYAVEDDGACYSEAWSSRTGIGSLGAQHRGCY